VTHSFTVSALDNLGNVVPGYTGTVRFTSAPTTGAMLPADYTFLPSDNGVHTFTAAFSTPGVFALTVSDTAMPALTGTQNGITVHNGQAPLLNIVNRRDLVWDPVRSLLYITTSDGKVQRYDPATQSLLTPLNVGAALYGVDITTDGSFLYIAEGQRGPKQSLIRKVDLAAGTVVNLPYNLGSLESGAFDIAIGAHGRALFSSRFDGSGPVALREIILATDAIAARTTITQDTQVQRGADRSLFFIPQSNSSAGSIGTYDPAADSFPRSVSSTAAYYDDAISAVNRDGTRIAVELGYLGAGYYGVSILDRDLNSVESLPPSYDGGVVFDPLRDLLYAINSTTDQVVAFDTNTWQERFRLAIGENVPRSNPFSSGVMTVSGDGRFLFVATPTGVRVLDLPGNPGVVSAFQIGDLPANVGRGTTATITVRALDALGSVVPGYTGTIRFTSTDPAAGLPANYTFQPADNGMKAFTVTFHTAGSRSLTVVDLAQPSLAGTQNTSVLNTPITLIPNTTRRDLVWDSTRGLLYFTTSTGMVERFDPATNTFLTPIKVGNVLNGMDLTPDGRFLYVAEDVRGATQAFVRKVDLATGVVTSPRYNVSGGEAGSWDIVIGPNGKALFDTTFEGSSSVALREILLASDSLTVRQSVSQNTHLQRAGDRSLTFLAQSNSSAGPIQTYDPATDSFPRSDSHTAAYHSTALQAVNRNGTLIAAEIEYLGSFRGVSILDRDLKAVENLGPNFNGGIVFDAARDLLHAVDPNVDQIVALETATWKEKFRIGIGEDIPANTSSPNTASLPFGNGVMVVSSDGRWLFLSTPQGIRVFSLPNNPGVVSTLQLSDYPVFTRQGLEHTFTVRALDNQGNVVPGYSGTVRFSSSPSAGAVLPADYTFTPADGGVKTFRARFTTPGTFALTVRDLSPPAVTGTQSGITIHDGQTPLVPLVTRRDLIWDPLRSLLWITTSDGKLQRYDPMTQTLLAPWSVGVSLNGADLTPDGRFLYVAENQRGLTQGFLRKVDLETGAVTNLAYDLGGLEGGVWDVAIASNGKGLFTTNFEGSGFTQVREFLLGDDRMANRLNVTQSVLLSRSADRNLIVIVQPNISSGPIVSYDALTDTFPRTINTGVFLGNSLAGVNRSSTLTAVELGSSVRIMDRNLDTQFTLTGVDGGIAFDSVRDVLYTVNAASDEIIALDTSTWGELFRESVGENLGGSGPFGAGVMQTSDDGMFLFLSTSSGIRSYMIGERLPLLASRFEPTSTGFRVKFSRPIDPAVLNLYDVAAGEFGPADVTLQDASGSAIRGSLALNPSATAFTFIRTGGLLTPGSYTATLRSLDSAFKDAAGGLLDGNGDNTTGDDFIASFVIATPPAVVVSVPDRARGPGQPIDLPLRLSNGDGITAVQLTLRYDPRLFTLTGATAGEPGAGVEVQLDTNTPGSAVLSFRSSSPLRAGANDFATLTAVVPTDAPYGAKHVLDLANIRINDGVIPAGEDDGLHIAAFPGDATGNARYSSTDAVRLLQLAVALEPGLRGYLLLDPVIVGDVTVDGRVAALDAIRVLQEAVGLDQAVIPPLPAVLPDVPVTGPDPLLNLPSTLRARPGETVTVPINLDLSDGLDSADLAVSYDPRRLEIVGVNDVRRGSLTSDFDLFVVNLDQQAGTLRAGLGRSAGAIKGRGAGSVLTIQFRVKGNAPQGRTILNLRRSLGQTLTQLNEGRLVLEPAPRDDAGDALDGAIRILGNERPPRPAAARAADTGLLSTLLEGSGDDRSRQAPADEPRPVPRPLRVADDFFRRLAASRPLPVDDLIRRVLSGRSEAGLEQERADGFDREPRPLLSPRERSVA
jgi:DNA-binding beta-propeller fold protein YncE